MSEPRPPRPPHFTMLRSFALPDLLTFGNAASGMGAILLCLEYSATGREDALFGAFALLPLALIFDALDGRVARWRHVHSRLGADLDSLADIVSFGVGPAVLGWTLGLRDLLDTVALVFLVACGISRLARYNVTADSLSDDSGKVRYFEGMPIPSSLLLVAMWGVLWALGRTGPDLWLGRLDLGPLAIHPLSLVYVLLGSAMVSATLRIPKL